MILINVDTEGMKYVMRHEDLDAIVEYAARLRATGNNQVAVLTDEDSLKLRTWLTNETPFAVLNDDDVPLVTGECVQLARESSGSGVFIAATTKACPNSYCKNRESHFHGHACHHVRQGCTECKTVYCFKCLSTKQRNCK